MGEGEPKTIWKGTRRKDMNIVGLNGDEGMDGAKWSWEINSRNDDARWWEK